MAATPELHLPDAQLLSQGAEARVFLARFFDRTAVVKQRFHKLYRHPALDEQLTARRTREEARSLQRCQRAGIRVPTVYAVDLANHTIYMEHIDAPSVKAHLQRHNTGAQAYGVPLGPLAARIGAGLARLHDLNLVHGDLTTSNLLHVRADGGDFDVVFIDFGLSYQSTLSEDKAVDLYVLERALSSTHPATEQLWQQIVEHYGRLSKNGAAVLSKLDEVRRRGRKRTMVG
eukprot:Unigene14286_Nuclearia_a/m.43110 Unigene14286_Nuclearia_a/g.43110  ORF Unigene14286_Nuclearia_a/g.43110 Unigene14286_Nuclearia_a/m.43110 type:complete len:231 (-) Unigene14286_Nuclearia_a:63-755(-)